VADAFLANGILGALFVYVLVLLFEFRFVFAVVGLLKAMGFVLTGCIGALTRAFYIRFMLFLLLI